MIVLKDFATLYYSVYSRRKCVTIPNTWSAGVWGVAVWSWSNLTWRVMVTIRVLLHHKWVTSVLAFHLTKLLIFVNKVFFCMLCFYFDIININSFNCMRIKNWTPTDAWFWLICYDRIKVHWLAVWLWCFYYTYLVLLPINSWFKMIPWMKKHQGCPFWMNTCKDRS